ncbi:MAG TPA: hypothetical protein VFA20_15680 [Myxococcaceae bacterium]|nr:hypothetical protein [Myxococcaceae bacterium]
MRALALTFALAALASPAAGAPYCWKEMPLPAGLGPLSGAVADGARRWLLQRPDHWSADVHLLEWDGARVREVPLTKEMIRGEPEPVGGPLVSFVQNITRPAVYLARWNGAGWEDLGTPTSAFPEVTPDVWLSAAALRRDGRPVAAWRPWDSQTTVQPLMVAAWEGGRWQPLGGPLDPLNDLRSAGVALAVDERNQPWIAWAAGTRLGAAVRVMRWSGAAWEDVGDTARGALGGAQAASDWRISLSVLPGGHAVVAWIPTGQQAVVAAEWNGERWSQMGQPLLVRDATGAPSWPTLAVGRDGAIYLAEQVADESEFDALYVQQWVAGGWQWVVEGAHLEETGHTGLVAFEAVGPSRLRLTWNESSPHVIEAGPCRWTESPEPFPRKRWLRADWPSTVAQAVDQTLSHLKPEEVEYLRQLTRDDLVQIFWGPFYGLAEGNDALLKDCGTPSSEDCSGMIMRRVWERVNAVQPPP